MPDRFHLSRATASSNGLTFGSLLQPARIKRASVPKRIGFRSSIKASHPQEFLSTDPETCSRVTSGRLRHCNLTICPLVATRPGELTLTRYLPPWRESKLVIFPENHNFDARARSY